RLVRPAEADLVDVDIDARVVVHLAQLGAPGQLSLALFLGRLGLLLSGTSATAASHAGEGPDRSVHHLDLAEPILDEGLEGILGRRDLAAVAVSDAPDPHA